MDSNSDSQPGQSTQQTRTTPPSSSEAEYAWLVHSQSTLRDTLPPSVDNKPLARQRRRRTSPEDQAILEAEFHRNPKPDKNARRAIVERVAGMGEKEVQIWFQNRRQNSRRRAQPMVPDNDAPALAAEESFVSAVDDNDDDIGAPAPHAAANASTASQPSQELSPTDELEQSVIPPSSAPAVMAAVAEPRPSQALNARRFRRTASGVRISLNSAGGARLLQANEASPSPPKPEKHLQGLIDPSSPVPMLDFSTPPTNTPRLRRGPSGRSRDSRSWEFWCDNDARNELGLKAKQEESGSASEAISLMRSQSGRSALSTMDRSSWLERSDSFKNTKRSRPSLGRSASNVDDLRPSKNARFELFEDETATGSPSKDDRATIKSASGDSDKENHDPNAPRSRRMPGAKKSGKPALCKSKTTPNQRVVPEHARQVGKKGFAHETDEELQRFMSKGSSGGKDHSGISSQDDLSCVQSLLFLSQGH